MSDTREEAIAALEDYLRRYPSGHFSELAQVRLDGLLAQKGEKKIVLASSAGNPFTAGTALQRTDFRVGDFYQYQRLDMYTSLVLGTIKKVVTEVTDLEVIFNRGVEITDALGNPTRTPDGRRFAGQQNFPAEYVLGKRWVTRYEVFGGRGPQGGPGKRGGGGGGDDSRNEVHIEYKVAAREQVSVPAGRFDTFRVEGSGYEVNHGTIRRFTYWMAPERVRRFIAREAENHRPKGSPERERVELVGFFEAGQR
jgi:hypothetical protein